MPKGVPCQYLDFEATVAVARLADDDKPLRFHADISIICRDCREPFMFEGVDRIGFTFAGPSLDIARTTLAVPIKPWDHALASRANYEMPR